MRTFWSVFAEVLSKLPRRFCGLVMANLVAYFVVGTYLSQHGVTAAPLAVMFFVNPLVMILWFLVDGGDVPDSLVYSLVFLWAFFWAAGVEWAFRRIVDRPKESSDE